MVLVLLCLFASAAGTSLKPAPTQKCCVNETLVPCKTTCPPQACNISYTTYLCDPEPKCIPGCDCIQNYLRTDEGVCVLNDDCPTAPTAQENVPPSNPGSQCGANETAVPCKTFCPPQFCNISYTEYLCDPNPNQCTPGCDCIKNYLRNNEGVCVLNDDCPPPSPVTEEPSTETPPPSKPPGKGCNGQTERISASSFSSANAASSSVANTKSADGKSTSSVASGSATSASSSESSASTKSKFKSADGKYTTTSTSTTSSAKSSASSSSYSYKNSTNSGPKKPGLKRDCTYNRCTPTCSLPYPQNCPSDNNPCNCPQGTLISEEGGKCVPREECQKYANCKGDYNATYTDCPIACPSTCAKPDAEYCNTQCGNLGCACDPGYILSKKNGKCIKPDDCPGGYPCRKNETFIGCLVKCPNSYCPVDDRRAIIACDPAFPCPSGCGCQVNYLRKSREDDRCILASECPPVDCTRQNEEWNPCPEPCFSDYCRDRSKVTAPGDCQLGSARTCNPQCVCKQGFYRNGTDICVTDQECPPIDQ